MDNQLEAAIMDVADRIASSSRVMALTGAGISVDSGIPAFRGAQGLWTKYDPNEYATIDAFVSNPARVWTMLAEMHDLITRASPNAGHIALAELERMGRLSALVTQNVDSLHQRAGSRNVIEFHGNGERLACIRCGKKYDRDQIDADVFPPQCSCDMVLKPDVVFFGELIPPEARVRAETEAADCEICLAIGTFAYVYPAADIPRIAKRNGAFVAEINLEHTDLTNRISDCFLQGSSTEILPAIVRQVKGKLACDRPVS